MEKPTYEECHYLNIGQCPNQFLLQKALLIPQLLDPTEITDAKRLCEKCRQILVEKRKDVRVIRPLRAIITRRDQEESLHGTILDVSSGGALVELEDLPNFYVDEICRLKIYSYDSFSDKSDTDAISVDGIVKRLTENKNEIAIVFIEESALDRIINI